MTFSILARNDGGAIGMAVCSSSPAVAARCLHLASGIGGVASQNITDPRFGPMLLDRLEQGDSAEEALAWLSAHDTTLEYRQISILPLSGSGVAYSGTHTLGTYASQKGADAIVAGNLLDNTGVIAAMLENFEASTGQLETRLLEAMYAGQQAGGEEGPVHSAGLAVSRQSGWNETDLRVDWSESPIEDLDKLLERWLPMRNDYVTRGIDPSTAPSYGVPGDE